MRRAPGDIRNNTRVLLVEVDAADSGLVAKLLDSRTGEHYELEIAHSVADAIDQLGSVDIDVLLLNFERQDAAGLDGLEQLERHAGSVPIVILSASSSEELAAITARAGAQDFLVTGSLDSDLLARSMRYSIERKRLYDALAESERRYRSIVDNAVSGVYRSTVSGRFESVNPALVTMLGYASMEELLSVPIVDLYHRPEDRPRAIRRFLEEEHLRSCDVEWRRRDGSLITARLTGRPYEGSSGPEGFEVFVEDVSERQRLEKQLFRSQRMEELGRLAGGVAHDFNNLLGVIIGFGDLLLKELSHSDPRRGRAEEIQRAAGRAANLTGQLLAFSRNQIMQPETLDLNAVLTSIESLLQRVLGEDIDFQVNPTTHLWPLRADSSKLEQIVVNLATNARHAMPRGGALTMETSNVTLDEADAGRLAMPAGEYVRLIVSDTGCGMDDEILSHAFEPFFTTRESDRGSGLGLATVYGIVKQSHGHVTVESSIGIGTTFSIYLPRFLGEDDSEPARSPQKAGLPTPIPPPSQEPERILVVEDDEALRMMITEILSTEGYDVLAFGEPHRVLDAVPSLGDPVHLLLTDLVMPRISGREIAERLLKLGAISRVLFMSGYAAESVQQYDAFERPGFIQKPFTTDALLRKVREMLDGPAESAADQKARRAGSASRRLEEPL